MEKDINKYVIVSIVTVAIVLVIFIGVITSKSVSESEESKFAEELTTYDEELGDFESASTQIGKSVEEAQSDDEEDDDENETAVLVENDDEKNDEEENVIEIKTEEKTTETNATAKQENVEEKKDESDEDKKEEKKEEIKFEAPIKGEIIMGFARENLVFSNTLQEWITHNGVDIKADKTSVVKAAAGGTVYAIKNDPRYGLTVIVNHDDDYQTIYSNLLTAEFVVEGENIEQGDTIGTVGNSAAFEIADEYHLHFELLKNNEYLDPTIYMSFE